MLEILLEAIIVLGPQLLVGYLLVRDGRRFWQSLRLLQLGRYTELRRVHERIAKSWLALFPSVRNASRYSIALTFLMEGDFERALSELGPLDRRRLDRNLTYAVSSLEAAALVLLGRDLDRAETLVEAVAHIRQVPEDLLVLAHAKHGLGKVAEAEALFARAGSTRISQGSKLGRVALIEFRAHHEAVFHTLRGLFAIKVGRPDEAVKDFARSASIPLQNWYTERARALLPPPGGDDDDPRSSLAPQVVDE